MKRFSDPTEPHQVIAEYAHVVVIPRVRKLLAKARHQRVPKREIDEEMDGAFFVIDRMLDAWPIERK